MDPRWIKYLIELRQRLIRTLWVLGLSFSVFVYFSNALYDGIASPLIQQLPAGSALIATQITTPFLMPIKLAFACSLFFSMPFLLYQLWQFIMPALFTKERHFVRAMILSSCTLFYLGMAFAFYVIAPLALRFFMFSAPSSVKMMTDIVAYLDFILGLMFVSGIAFQIPIATVLCVRLGLCSRNWLIKQRPLIIIGSFTLGMLLTPPDVCSQILLAIPMWGLFECGLLYLKADNLKSTSPTKRTCNPLHLPTCK